MTPQQQVDAVRALLAQAYAAKVAIDPDDLAAALLGGPVPAWSPVLADPVQVRREVVVDVLAVVSQEVMTTSRPMPAVWARHFSDALDRAASALRGEPVADTAATTPKQRELARRRARLALAEHTARRSE